ncbi:hypothetical protein DP091_15715 [Paenibacillus sp. MDMC362]|nr:hypothetical protein DP091_15715 [Paenibacillus sp. MDMC362]
MRRRNNSESKNTENEHGTNIPESKNTETQQTWKWKNANMTSGLCNPNAIDTDNTKKPTDL